MSWIAVIPLKPPGDRKTRLFGRLDPLARETMAEVMLAHVAETLASIERIERIELLCSDRPSGWPRAWRLDEARGLNVELDAALTAHRPGRVLILHADLPLVDAADIEALLDAAEWHGLAIAPDRHGSGTNALAIADDRRLACRFGRNSFHRHRVEAGPHHGVVRRHGLGLDCDTSEDLDCAMASGFAPHF